MVVATQTMLETLFNLLVKQEAKLNNSTYKEANYKL